MIKLEREWAHEGKETNMQESILTISQLDD